jgi:hypothetical protein
MFFWKEHIYRLPTALMQCDTIVGTAAAASTSPVENKITNQLLITNTEKTQ